jgi:hypothetical protein
VRLFTVLFGAGAFENSVLLWSCEHRSHHKHVDHDEDPYCITKGLFYAHMGWLMFKLKPLPPFDNVVDLRKDPLVAWQHRYIHLIAVLVAFVLQASIGFAWKRKPAKERAGFFQPRRGKPNTRVTSRKVDTVSFVSIADEGRSCGTKTPERARKSKCLGRRCHLVSSNLLSQPL